MYGEHQVSQGGEKHHSTFTFNNLASFSHAGQPVPTARSLFTNSTQVYEEAAAGDERYVRSAGRRLPTGEVELAAARPAGAFAEGLLAALRDDRRAKRRREGGGSLKQEPPSSFAFRLGLLTTPQRD